MALRDRIIEILDDLPESNLQQVLNFVEFLTWRTLDQEEPLLAVAGILEGHSLSAKEIEQTLYGEGNGADAS